MTTPTRLASLIVLTLPALAGCLGSNPPVEPRWFTPAPAAAPTSTSQGLPLGQVTAAAHLAAPMTWRLSPVEVAYDELHRWAAPPAELLRAALERRFDVRTGTPSVDFHLLEFAAVRGGSLEARVEFRYRVADGDSGTIDAASPCDSDDPAAVARAMGAALEDALTQLAGQLGSG